MVSPETCSTSRATALEASWRRSRAAGVDPGTIDPAYDGEPTARLSVLARTAIAAIEDIAHTLTTEPVSLLLTDDRAVVVHRWCADRDLRVRLDRVRLLPGFAYSESGVGTNGIGTAVETRRPALVTGEAHFVSPLAGFSCAGVPLRHPTTGSLVGVVNLTADAGFGTALMLPFVRAVAAEIERCWGGLPTPAPRTAARAAARAAARRAAAGTGAQSLRERTPMRIEALELQAIRAALRAARGDVAEAAALVGLSRATIYRRMRRYRLVSS